MNEKQKKIRNFGNKDCLKVTRGMVFWYDLNSKMNKYSSPKVEVGGKMYPDHKQYGPRDWLVVSNDINNGNSPTCTVVPISAQGQKAVLPTHVHYTYMGTSLTVLCEQIQTINTAELVEYRYTVSDRVMDQVNEALALQLGIPKKHLYLDGDVVDNAFGKIESIIEGIIKSKVEKISRQKASSLDVEDAVLRLGTGLEMLFKESGLDNLDGSESKDEVSEIAPNPEDGKDTPDTDKGDGSHHRDVKPKSQTEKFYDRYPDKRPKPQQDIKPKTSKSKKKESSESKRKRRDWTEESMKQFLKDVQEMSPTECAKKWEFDTIKRMYSTKYYVQVKLGKVSTDS